jgi:hypothetical protein
MGERLKLPFTSGDSMLSSVIQSMAACCCGVCNELKDHVFCYRVLFCVLSSQRGSSRVYFHDVSLMYTCVESAHGVEGGALGQRT